MTKAGALWREMTDIEKAKFEKQHVADQERYQKQMADIIS
jgi:hypothetical protein